MLQTAETVQSIEPNINQYKAIYEDTSTWLAEVLDGQMQTEFRFGFNGHELIGEDGRELGRIFETAIEDAQDLVKDQPQLMFELRRRRIERSEYNDMLAMAKGELPNTMVVVSDFPPELMEARTDIGGYNVRRQQTMLRIISKQEDGSLVVQSQSLDGSYRYALEAIFDALGTQPKPGELLGQRIHLDLPGIWQPQLIDNLTSVYDQKLKKQMGGEWYAGRRPIDYLNTYNFVLSQHDLVNSFVKTWLEDREEGERLRYGLAAAIDKRFENRWINAEKKTLEVTNITPPEYEMHAAASHAASKGKNFSGCGLTLTAENETTQKLQELGYGNKTEKSQEAYKFDKEMYCVVCQDPPKKGETKKMCGPCGICRSCDSSLRKVK